MHSTQTRAAVPLIRGDQSSRREIRGVGRADNERDEGYHIFIFTDFLVSANNPSRSSPLLITMQPYPCDGALTHLAFLSIVPTDARVVHWRGGDCCMCTRAPLHRGHYLLLCCALAERAALRAAEGGEWSTPATAAFRVYSLSLGTIRSFSS